MLSTLSAASQVAASLFVHSGQCVLNHGGVYACMRACVSGEITICGISPGQYSVRGANKDNEGTLPNGDRHVMLGKVT